MVQWQPKTKDTKRLSFYVGHQQFNITKKNNKNKPTDNLTHSKKLVVWTHERTWEKRKSFESSNNRNQD